MWNFSAAHFVNRLYKVILRRDPDQDGHALWTKLIAEGKDPTIAVDGLANSEEYQSLLGRVATGGISCQTPITIRRPGYDFVVTVHARDDIYISESIKSERVWEPFSTLIVERLLVSCLAFYDIGANIGWFSLVAGKVLSGRGVVHSFEPAYDNAPVFVQNVLQNSLTNVRFAPCALGRSTQTGRIFFSENNKGDHRVYASDEVRGSSPVGITTLDEYFDHESLVPILVKIDTQGSEFDVILGMTGVLSERRRDVILIIEFWPVGLRRNGETALQLIEFLQRLGFAGYTMEHGQAQLVPADWADLARYAVDDAIIENGQFVDLILFREGSLAGEAVAEFVKHR